MIHIEETRFDNSRVAIRVYGNLDRNSLPTLKKVCRRYLDNQANVHVSLHLEELLHCCTEAKGYLKDIRGKVTYVGLPEFMKLELFGSQN